jgi:hypothetical protein
LIQIKSNMDKRIIDLSLIRINTLIEAGLQPWLKTAIRDKSEER